MNKKPDEHKLLFIIPNLDRGGSERVFTTIVQHIDLSKFDVTVVVVTRPGVYYDQLPSDIQKILIGVYRVKYAGIALARVINQQKPDTIFTFNVNHLNLIVIPVLLLLRFQGALMTRESNILSVVTAKKGKLRSIIDSVYRQLYRRVDYVIAQSTYMQQDLIRHFGISPKQTVVVNNPIIFSKIQQLAQQQTNVLNSDRIRLLAVGRLTYQKGFDLLIKAIAYLPNQYHLTILGGETYEHPEYAQELYDLVDELDLKDQVSFIGFQENPYPYMRQAALLVLPSRHEGFPNVAIEAMALGTPIIAFDSPGGQNDLIESGENGWLVPFGDLQALAQTVVQASQKLPDRDDLSNSIRERYDIHSVVSSYESLLVSPNNRQ